MSIDKRLDELGLTLPPVPDAAGNYVHTVRTRSAVGMGSLPSQIPVEIECIVELTD